MVLIIMGNNALYFTKMENKDYYIAYWKYTILQLISMQFFKKKWCSLKNINNAPPHPPFRFNGTAQLTLLQNFGKNYAMQIQFRNDFTKY